MGVLSALVSDIVLPYGLQRDGEGAQLRAKIEEDIEKHLSNYSVDPIRGDLQIVRIPADYFRSMREFHGDARTIIQADYTRGAGYDGFMKQAGPKFFGDAVRAVSDVWNTILDSQAAMAEAEPSKEAQTWYRVDEVGYQLQVKKNPRQASRAYTYFSTVNPGIPEAYEAVGDLFYQTGDERQGVREWEQALAYPGATRNRVASKLGEHYITMGQAALGKAREDAGVRDLELERALHNFEQALQYNRGSDEAVGMITQTNETIRERNDQRKLTMALITTAQDVLQEAEKANTARDFSASISTYETAISLFQQVTTDFPEQYTLAQNGVRDSQQDIRRIIRSLLDSAADAVADGDILKDERKWDQARNKYMSVEDILRPVPDTDSIHAREKTEAIEKAREKLSELEIEQKRVEAAEAAAAASGPPKQ
jgi:tetratricopeptide (TPR) repeat protein